MTRIIDLDEAIPQDIEVVLNGETYLLPGDIPVPDMLAMESLTRRFDAEKDAEKLGEIVGEMNEQVIELFRVRQPDIEDLPMSAKQLFQVVTAVYMSSDESDENEGGKAAVNPKKPATSRRKTKTSRGGK